MKSLKILLSSILLYSVFAHAHANNTTSGSDTLTFYCNELLGRPTANSITVHACANKNMDVYYEFGTDSISYTSQTTTQSTLDSIPFIAVLKNLNPNTQYYYRMRYRVTGLTDFSARPSHTFHTQRSSGSNFTFAVEADPHLDTNSTPASYVLSLQNILAQKPDFLFDLGDTFMSEKLTSKTQPEITRRHLLLRSYFDLTCHSIPLFLVIGNHEGESGWLLNGTATSLPVMASNTRTLFYPNPVPDSFYTGNSTPENFVGLRQNYYAFEWGNSLFLVLDPYWYTSTKPGWGWTLGQAQYDWFKNTLRTSKAKFKFVFCHQLVGGNGNDARGGTEFVDLFESGGKNTDSTWGFGTYRPTWEKPLHQLMVENNVTIYFHGHDHFYDKQEKDGVIYQEVPQPSNRNIKNTSAASYGYTEGVILPGRGYLALSITDTSAQVQYIKTLLPSEETATSHNKDVAHSYTIIKGNSTTGVAEYTPGVNTFALEQNYPNPFNPSTKIHYQIASGNNVSLKAFNTMGQEVKSLVNEFQQPGQYTVNFNTQENRLSSGIYYCRIITGAQSKVIKMLYLK
jgi:hypothetical protein